MIYVDLGLWSPPIRAEDASGQVFARYQNAAGEDWYAAVAHNPERPTGLAIAFGQDGKVIFRGDDVAHIEPSSKHVIVLPDWTGSEEEKDGLFGKLFNLASGEFVDPPVGPIGEVTRAQALMALHKSGLLAQVRAAVAAHPLEEVRIWFDNAGKWQRHNPYVLAVAAELGLTEEQVDALFLAANLEG